ncbi:copper-translocating P-type ATPase [Tubulinosema ratisbonensis]|uniref:Copper-translocating P-type ATPase n=1 Tax=Tubulinosema ratisbonensis TaxID=291195 RepID=A0A437ANK8_9MICR|nr:copper-translocating P-type ATPase [Tubulinosema ratisbonensis]
MKSKITSEIFTVSNIHCVKCIKKIEKALLQLEGIYKVNTNLFLKQTKVYYDSMLIDSGKILSTLKSYGFACEVYGFKWIGLFITVLCVFIAQNFGKILYKNLLSDLFLASIPVFLVFTKLRKKKLLVGDNFVINGAIVSYLLGLLLFCSNYSNRSEITSYLEMSSVIILFVFFGKFLEECIKLKNAKIIKILQTNEFKENEKSFSLDNVNLNIGDIILIEKGVFIPADGFVYKGETFVNESNLTGEFSLMHKKTSSLIYAGTTNISHPFYLKITNLPKNTYMGRILNLLQDANFSYSYENRLFLYFTYSVNYFTILLFFFHLLVNIFYKNKFSLFYAIKSSLSVLVISCPCVFSIAIPITFLMFNYELLTKGIIIKDVNPLFKKIKYIMFDKTGTLTEGKLNVIDYKITKYDEEFVFNMIRLIEEKEDHPVAKALFYFTNENLKSKIQMKLKNKKYFSSLGIEGEIEFKEKIFKIKIGKESFVIKNIRDNNKTFISINEEFTGYFILGDKIRNESLECINKLKEMNFYCIMLTGDTEERSKNVNKLLNMHKMYANLTAEEKMRIILQYKTKGGVLMIGDGINDAPAIKASDLGVSISKINNTANIIFLKEDLSLIIYFLKMKKKLTKKIKISLFFSIFYNLISIPLASGLFYNITPKTSCLFMLLSSLSVILNSFIK